MEDRLERIYEAVIALPKRERMAKAKALREQAATLTPANAVKIKKLAAAIEAL